MMGYKIIPPVPGRTGSAPVNNLVLGVHSKGEKGDTGVPVDTTPGVTSQATGSTFYIMQCAATAATFSTPTDNFTNTYVAVGSQVDANGLSFQTWACVNGAGGAAHVASAAAVGGASNQAANIFFVEVKGAALASAVDTGATATGSDASSPFTITSGTLAQAASMVIACIQGDSGSNPATLAESSGFTITDQSNNGTAFWPSGVAIKVVNATTAVTASFTQTGSTNTNLKIIAIKSS